MSNDGGDEFLPEHTHQLLDVLAGVLEEMHELNERLDREQVRGVGLALLAGAAVGYALGRVQRTR